MLRGGQVGHLIRKICSSFFYRSVSRGDVSFTSSVSMVPRPFNFEIGSTVTNDAPLNNNSSFFSDQTQITTLVDDKPSLPPKQGKNSLHSFASEATAT